LAAHVRRIHVASREAYSARKIWKALVAEGIACGHHRVARVRREQGIEASRRRRFKVTHYARRHKNTAPNRLRRQFQAERPNQCWVGDVTFISTRVGWLYLAVLIDLCSRKVVGWAMSDRNDESPVSVALRMVITHRQPAARFIHHTDRGSALGNTNRNARQARGELTDSDSSSLDQVNLTPFWSTPYLAFSVSSLPVFICYRVRRGLKPPCACATSGHREPSQGQRGQAMPARGHPSAARCPGPAWRS
jgi:Transposase and inactivated derivatives